MRSPCEIVSFFPLLPTMDSPRGKVFILTSRLGIEPSHVQLAHGLLTLILARTSSVKSVDKSGKKNNLEARPDADLALQAKAA